jgi:hypothetical protein
MLLAVASVLGAPVCAGDQIGIASDGTVHSVSAGYEFAIGNSNPIVHVEQSPFGDSVTRILPGTENGANFHPSIEIDPVADVPVVVWTRVEQGDAEIYLARFDGTEWTDPIAVAPGRGDDVDPEIRIGQSLVHVLWRRETGGSDFVLLRASLDRATLALAIGPVNLQGFILPPGMEDVNDPAAAWVGSRFVLSFVVGNQLLYTVLEGGEWSDLRRINLDGISTAEARNELEAMLLRTDPARGS